LLSIVIELAELASDVGPSGGIIGSLVLNRVPFVVFIAPPKQSPVKLQLNSSCSVGVVVVVVVGELPVNDMSEFVAGVVVVVVRVGELPVNDMSEFVAGVVVVVVLVGELPVNDISVYVAGVVVVDELLVDDALLAMVCSIVADDVVLFGGGVKGVVLDWSSIVSIVSCGPSGVS